VTNFDTTKKTLNNILQDITKGEIQLPDFQRGWVWDDDHIKDLMASIARSFPIGAVMLLETGGDVRFQTRPLEGLEERVSKELKPSHLILDGQQRLTTLTQAIALTSPVQTRTNKGKKIQRHYYFNIHHVLKAPNALEEAIITVDENRQLHKSFGREVELDLSTRELECQQFYFPCDQIMNSDDWEITLHKVDPGAFPDYMKFRERVINAFRNYQLPIIELKKETSKEAVCLVFEKVNTGGVPLSVFELITASYAAEGYNLRDDWFGSDIRQVESRKERLEQDPLLKGIEATEFLQAITLLHTHYLRQQDFKTGKSRNQARPVSAKRRDMLELPLEAWKKYADTVEEGFRLAARFLKKECFFDRREIPYSPQMIPLAAVLSKLGDRWLEPRIYEKLSRWYWCGALGELYSGAVETRIANDYEELQIWFDDDASEPRTVQDASFQQQRFDTLRSRGSAAYKAINVLILREGAKDWFWKASIQELDSQEIALDIHHIFPKAWCKKHGIPREVYDCILNKTMISYRANRKIGGGAPSRYLQKIQEEKQVQLSDTEMDEILETHALSPALLRADDFEAFIEERRKCLIKLVDAAMGKKVAQNVEVLTV